MFVSTNRVVARRCAVAAMLALGAGSAVTATGAFAQQQADANGIVFSAEAGPAGKPSLFSLMSAKGAIDGVALRVVEGAKVPAVGRAAGTQVGTLRLDSVSSLLRLTIPRGTSSSSGTLLRRGALKVVFSPMGRNVLTITGLPARTTSLQLALRGGRGQLLSSASCRDEQNFQATVTRGGKSVHARAGATC